MCDFFRVRYFWVDQVNRPESARVRLSELHTIDEMQLHVWYQYPGRAACMYFNTQSDRLVDWRVPDVT